MACAATKKARAVGSMSPIPTTGLKNALRRTSLEHVDLRSLLMQLDGAYNTKKQLWFGPIRHRAIHIPTSTLMAMGIEVKTPPARFTGPAQDSF